MSNGVPVRRFSHCTGAIYMYVLVIVSQVGKSVNHLLAYYQPRGTADFLPDFCSKFWER